MDDFVERIRVSLRNQNSEPWFPELTAGLAARAWDSLHRDIGLPPDSYGTERVLSRSISAPRDIITSLKTCPSTAAAPAILIEALTQKCAGKYQEKGVSFYSPDEILQTKTLSCIEDALAIVNQVPSLLRTVAALVRSLHIIKPQDPDYDLSFSEPHVPFSVFLSVPASRIANDSFRIAESLVHEAMHLQLTLLEKVTILVASETRKYYSPWRNDYRDARGVLHGLYVFAVIDRFLARTLSGAEGLVAQHIKARRHEIRGQISQIKSFPYCSDLSLVGARFAERLARSSTHVTSHEEFS